MVISESDALVVLFEVNTGELIHSEEFCVVHHQYIKKGVCEILCRARSV